MRKKILVVEDDRTLAEGLELLLVDEGYDVFIQVDGRSVIRRILENNINLMLIDYRLPGKDGVSVIKQIRSSKFKKKIPIILMSASQNNMHEVSKTSGADAFLTKPFEIDELFMLIKRLLSN